MFLKDYLCHPSNFAYFGYRRALILSRAAILKDDKNYPSAAEIKAPALYLLAANDTLYSHAPTILVVMEKAGVKKDFKHLLQFASNSTRALLKLLLYLNNSNQELSLTSLRELDLPNLILAINALALSVLEHDYYDLQRSTEETNQNRIIDFTRASLFPYRQFDINHRLKILLAKSNLDQPTTKQIALFYYLAGIDALYCNAKRFYNFKCKKLQTSIKENPHLGYLRFEKDDFIDFAFYLVSSDQDLKDRTHIFAIYNSYRRIIINSLLIRYDNEISAYLDRRYRYDKKRS